MIRNLKTLGLALVAVFAMSAMAAGAAQAEDADFWTDEDAVLVDAVGHTNQIFQTPVGTLVCTEVTGTSAAGDEGPTLTGEDIAYEDCHATNFGLSFPVTVDMNGCHYTFTAGTMTGADTSEGSVHIENCEENGSITISVYNTSSHATKRCEIHVPEQTVDGITYHNGTNNGAMAVTVEANQVEVTDTVTDFNTLGCNNHVHGIASYTGSFWANATDESEDEVDATITGTP